MNLGPLKFYLEAQGRWNPEMDLTFEKFSVEIIWGNPAALNFVPLPKIYQTKVLLIQLLSGSIRILNRISSAPSVALNLVGAPILSFRGGIYAICIAERLNSWDVDYSRNNLFIRLYL